MNNTNTSPERIKKIAESLRQSTPEEDKKFDEGMAEVIKKVNEYTKKMGWQEKKK
jgi:hypothetical protein